MTEGIEETTQRIEGFAPPRPCAVCERVCPVALLADLEVAEVCELCKPLVIALLQTSRNGARKGYTAIERAVEVARELEEVCTEVERAGQEQPEAG